MVGYKPLNSGLDEKKKDVGGNAESYVWSYIAHWLHDNESQLKGGEINPYKEDVRPA